MDSKAALRPIVIGVVLVALFAFFFVYPGHDPKPHDLPVLLVGENDALEKILERNGFSVSQAKDARDAREQILDRDAYAAIDFEEQRALVSTAASVPVAEQIRFASQAVSPDFQVEDIRPTDDDDPRGLSINLAVLATTVPAILGAMLIVTLAPMVTGARRLGAIAAFSALGGLASALIIHQGIGAIPGDWLAVLALTAFAVFSIGVTAAALIQLLGPAGVGLSFLLLLMLGNPASGAPAGPYLLPEPWRTGGQYMPPGAFASGLRNVAYFDGAQAAMWGSVLATWAVVGSLLVLRVRRHVPHVLEPAD